MTFQNAQRLQQAARPAPATFRTWRARARTGERLEYNCGHLAIDRTKRTGSLKESDRRKLTAVADHALALAGRKRLHLQERHDDRDYSYWMVARAPVRGGQA